MKYVFFGTPDFAVIILNKLIEASFIPEAIVCNPDRPVGRKKIITPPPTKILAQKYGIKVYQPEKLDKEFVLQVSSFRPDFFVVAAYAKIIPQEILDIPKLGTIGVHPSLLPKYRGASPIQSAILSGNEKTGTTLYLMDEKMDHGAILANSELRMQNSEWNYEKLMKKLAELSVDLLIETLPKFIKDEVVPMPQNESEATFTKKFITQDGFVEPEDLKIALEKGGEKAVEIDRKVRALNPEPGVWTIKDGKRMKILETITRDSLLVLKKIQFEGKKSQEL